MEISELSANPPWVDITLAFKCQRCNHVEFVEVDDTISLQELLATHRHPSHSPQEAGTFDVRSENK